MSDLYQVAYCSRNRISGAPNTVEALVGVILARSRANNARDGITGGLLFSDNCFAQVLEGPMEAVVAAFERIQCDERHGEVTVVASGPIRTRDFPEWSMAFTGAHAPGAGRVAGLGHALTTRTVDGDAVLGLLRSVVVRETEWLEAV